MIPQLSHISLVADYFPLFLLLGVGVSGLFLRHLTKTDVVAVKEMVIGLVTFSPAVPETIAPWLSAAGEFKRAVKLPVFHAARIADLASARYQTALSMNRIRRPVRIPAGTRLAMPERRRA